MPRWKTDAPVEIRAVEENLYSITTSFTAGSHGRKQLHSYYLVHPEGRFLFDGPDRSDFYKQNHAFFVRHGGIDKQIMSHGADVSPASSYVEKTYRAPIYIHDADVEHAIRKRKGPITGSFSTPHSVARGLEALPLPGHTPGFTVFLWSGSKRYLVSGDIIAEDSGGWSAFISTNPHQIGADSLRRMMDVECDLLLPSETAGDRLPPIPFSRAERETILRAVLRRVAKKYKTDVDLDSSA